MLNSRYNTTFDVVKAKKAFLVMLSIVLMYQLIPTTSQTAFASSPTFTSEFKQYANVQNPQIVAEQPKPKKAAFLDIVDTNEKVRYSKTDFFCMAKNIYHEAGHEPITGRYAVAQVTLNRMENENYPDSVCGVVFQHKQFSWANNHGRRWTTPTGPAWEESKRIAHEVLDQGKRVKGLDDALFYHATYVRPVWARTKDRVTRIGQHIFYEA